MKGTKQDIYEKMFMAKYDGVDNQKALKILFDGIEYLEKRPKLTSAYFTIEFNNQIKISFWDSAIIPRLFRSIVYRKLTKLVRKLSTLNSNIVYASIRLVGESKKIEIL